MLRIGHRGAGGYNPENILESFKKAIELGIDIIELDVQRCKTGEIVVMHDFKVDRTTNGKGYVAGKTLTELEELDAGHSQKIPTLAEVLSFVAGRIGVEIELKSEGIATDVAKIIKNCLDDGKWKPDFFVVASFNHYELLDFKKLMPDIAIAPFLVGIPIGYAEFGEKMGAKVVNIYYEAINKNFVEDTHKRGMQIIAWTVNDEESIARLRALGVDGIISDYPDKI